MPGHILLEGGAEFGGKMAAPDQRAIELAGGFEAPLGIIPAAAAPDHNDHRAGQTGLRWFRKLGARDVTVIPLTDRASANAETTAEALRRCRFIYLLGGFPHYLGQTLAGSRSWKAMLEAYEAGAIVGGSSAGAMVLCEHYYAPETQTLQSGLNLVPGACLIPHHDTMGQKWVSVLTNALPQALLIGIDEQTGMVSEGASGQWKAYGKGQITLYRHGATAAYLPGDTFSL